MKELQSAQIITEDYQYTQTIGIEWNSVTDNVRITATELDYRNTTKQTLNLKCFQNIRYSRLVLPNHHQSQDPVSKTLGT